MKTKFIYTAIFSGLGLFSYLLLANYTNLNDDVMQAISSTWAVLFFIMAFNILGFATISLSGWINNRYRVASGGQWKIIATYGLVTLMLFLLNYGLLVSAKLLAGAAHPFMFPNGGVRIITIVLLVELVILVLMIANNSIKNALKLQKQSADLQQENNRANYAALQNQLNPHFLFNSLNTLIAEIEYDPRGAVVFTRNLSDVYRYVLQCQDKPLVTITQELEFVKAYLFLHTVRLGDCIHWNARIEECDMDRMIPPLTLQLLVENVIKHNSITSGKPMDIEISIQEEHLVVSNTVNLKKTKDSSGVGLKNLSKRCQLILGRDIEVTNQDGYFTVKIPMQND